jgi:hypothetical protein
MKRTVFHLSIFIFLLCSACGGDNTSSSKSTANQVFSFENGMEGWTAGGIDLDIELGTITWSIQRTQEKSTDGTTSVKLFMDNSNDAGKIWIERQFNLATHTTYHVNIKYNFASMDWGDLNFFAIIAGVIQRRPQSREDVVYQEETWNGYRTETDYIWLEKDYDYTVQTGADGLLYVFIGVAGTYEIARTYYLDNIRVTFTKQ